jgi:hypothetical protein
MLLGDQIETPARRQSSGAASETMCRSVGPVTLDLKQRAPNYSDFLPGRRNLLLDIACPPLATLTGRIHYTDIGSAGAGPYCCSACL